MVEADDVFKPEILAKIRELGNELKKNVPFSDDILSLTDCEFSIGIEDGIEIINLVPDKIPQSNKEIEKMRKMALSKELIAGKLVSKDSTQSWIILRLHPFPQGWRNDKNQSADYVSGQVANKIINQKKYEILNPKPAGMPVLTTDKTNFFKKEMKRTMLLSLLASTIVLILALRSFKGIVVSLFAAFSGIIILFGFQGHFGHPVDTSMLLVPVYLGIAVSIAYSIHIYSFFHKEFKRTGKRKNSAIHSIEETGWPVLFTALTTAAALISFLLIDIKPIQWVGAAASSLILILLLIALIVIPSVISIGFDKEAHKLKASRIDNKIDEFMEFLSQFVMKNQLSIVVIFFIIVTMLSIGLGRFEVSFDMEKTMGTKVPYVKRLVYVNDTEVGSLYSNNLVINLPKEGMAREPQNLKNFDLLIKKAESQQYTKRVTSIVEIIKDMNRTLHENNNEYYKIPDTREMLAQIMLLYENAGGKEADKWVDYEYKRLRMMIELSDYNSQDVKNEIIELENEARKLFPGSQVEVAGTVAQFTFMQDIISRGQVKSFLIALVLITIMMVIVTGSIKTGFIAMIPNITPALAVGGLMGWTGIPLDIFTITIMPMLLGLAVDDTIHFISHSKLEYERNGNYATAIRRTFKSTGIPILFTSLIICANFLVYASSPANVYIHLGILTSVGIMSALLTDFLVTPVLINRFKPFGPETAMDKKNIKNLNYTMEAINE
eukprot:gnl/Chilomastix_cuspidata/8984.p1 GENE.gnl/Chilomastix_cuspidata/8984~~gnl/Chilomastix_cuspidata/8984.p1  ORF type:complete len:800 (+),score=30.93 gnl/Chilomastix_cuspidata/8984:238-2400(+)